jgi:WD40 repeat protein
VRTALLGLGAMVRSAFTRDGSQGFEIYHASLHEHLQRTDKLRDSRATMRGVLVSGALAPAGDAAANYFYRAGIGHLVENDRADAAPGLLSDFGYMMSRLQHLAAADPAGAQGIEEDWQAIQLANITIDGEAASWRQFWRRNLHVLRRGHENWPCFKLLLQLAWEHAEDSPVTRACEAWLSVPGNGTWTWWRTVNRSRQLNPDSCLAVLEGHVGDVEGALELKDGRILSWASDAAPRLWAPDGQLLAVLEGHPGCTKGALELRTGHLLTWSAVTNYNVDEVRQWTSHGQLLGRYDRYGISSVLELRDGRVLLISSGALEKRDGQLHLVGTHSGMPELNNFKEAPVRILVGAYDACELRNGNLLSWWWDRVLRLWGPEGQQLRALTGHDAVISGVRELRDGRLLSWADDGMRLWTADGRLLRELDAKNLDAVIELHDGRLLSWSRNRSDLALRLWAKDGRALDMLQGHTAGINGAIELRDWRLLSWSDDGTLRLWTADGQALGLLQGHLDNVWGAIQLRDASLLSWGRDDTLRLWTRDGQPVRTHSGHTKPVQGAIELQHGYLLSWSSDKTLRIWVSDRESSSSEPDAERVDRMQLLRDGRLTTRLRFDQKTLQLRSANNRRLASLMGHSERVWGWLELQDGCLLSWSSDGTLRLWAADGRSLGVLEGHGSCSLNVSTSVGVVGALELRDGRLLSWGWDGTMRLWTASGQLLRVLEGHRYVDNAVELRDGRLLSWGCDTLRLWSANGQPLCMFGNDLKGVPSALELSDGRLLTWSPDEPLRLWTAAGDLLGLLDPQELMHGTAGALKLRDGRLLSRTSLDGRTLHLWSSDGQPLRDLKGHTRPIRGARELKDGRLVSWSEDMTLRLWTAGGQLLRVLQGHSDRVKEVLELRDGRLLLCCMDGNLCLWTADGERNRDHFLWLAGLVAGVFESSGAGGLVTLFQDGSIGVLEEHEAESARSSWDP